MFAARKIISFALSLAITFTVVMASNALAAKDAAAPINGFGDPFQIKSVAADHSAHEHNHEDSDQPLSSPAKACLELCLEQATLLNIVSSPSPRLVEKSLSVDYVASGTNRPASIDDVPSYWPTAPPPALFATSLERLLLTSSRLRV